jgi:hypothetical protein
MDRAMPAGIARFPIHHCNPHKGDTYPLGWCLRVHHSETSIMKYNSYASGQILSTHPQYMRALREADRIRSKEELKQRFNSISRLFKGVTRFVQKHPIVFSAVMIVIILN